MDEVTILYLSALLGMYIDLKRRIVRIEKLLNGMS